MWHILGGSHAPRQRKWLPAFKNKTKYSLTAILLFPLKSKLLCTCLCVSVCKGRHSVWHHDRVWQCMVQCGIGRCWAWLYSPCWPCLWSTKSNTVDWPHWLIGGLTKRLICQCPGWSPVSHWSSDLITLRGNRTVMVSVIPDLVMFLFCILFIIISRLFIFVFTHLFLLHQLMFLFCETGMLSVLSCLCGQPFLFICLGQVWWTSCGRPGCPRGPGCEAVGGDLVLSSGSAACNQYTV